jgi:hypothetical protein
LAGLVLQTDWFKDLVTKTVEPEYIKETGEINKEALQKIENRSDPHRKARELLR